ncbi:MAG: hypothetical protein M3521_08875 [Acidobacteriota bacterium]|nr:hypothetical protein [Acidobacteriota bacterium]
MKKIISLFDVAEIHGSDVCSFIFAEKENCAIEIYQSKDAVLVEFWENGKQQTEIEVDSYEKATKLVIDWIKEYL